MRQRRKPGTSPLPQSPPNRAESGEGWEAASCLRSPLPLFPCYRHPAEASSGGVYLTVFWGWRINPRSAAATAGGSGCRQRLPYWGSSAALLFLFPARDLVLVIGRLPYLAIVVTFTFLSCWDQNGATRDGGSLHKLWFPPPPPILTYVIKFMTLCDLQQILAVARYSLKSY